MRDLSTKYPGTSNDSISGRTSKMWTFPVSAHVAMKYG